jgi:hypothetical protein
MVKRLAIGATAASALIFSVILLSNFTLFVSSQDRARLYSQSDAEDSLGVNAIVLTGAAGANLLLEAQSAVGSQTLNCQTATGVVGSEIAGLADAQRAGGLSVYATSRVIVGGSLTDNLSMLAPFNGSVASDLDIDVLAHAVGKDVSSGVSLDKFEWHLVHIPVRLGSLVADCLGSLQALLEDVSTTHLPNCTTSTIAPVLARVSLGPSSNASKDGFNFGFGFAITSSKPCSVSLKVSIEQSDVEGLGGPFTVRMEAEGSASFAK